METAIYLYVKKNRTSSNDAVGFFRPRRIIDLYIDDGTDIPGNRFSAYPRVILVIVTFRNGLRAIGAKRTVLKKFCVRQKKQVSSSMGSVLPRSPAILFTDIESAITRYLNMSRFSDNQLSIDLSNIYFITQIANYN